MAEILTQVLQPTSVADQRSVGFDDDQGLELPSRRHLQDHARPASAGSTFSTQESTITPATNNSDRAATFSSRPARSSLSGARLSTPGDISDRAIGQALVKSAFSIRNSLVEYEPVQKKTTRPNTRECWTRSVYFSTGPPDQPGCLSSSLPTNLIAGLSGSWTQFRTTSSIDRYYSWQDNNGKKIFLKPINLRVLVTASPGITF